MTPDRMFRVEARRCTSMGVTTYHLRLLNRHNEKLCGVLMLDRDEYGAFWLLAEAVGVEILDVTDIPVSAA